jgi:hypothetical protein
MTTVQLEAVWLCISLVALLVYLRLRHRASTRSSEAQIPKLSKTHPVRILAEARLRNNTLFLITGVLSSIAAALSLARDAFNFAWEAPAGLSVLAIFWTFTTIALVGVLDDHDDVTVDKIIASRSEPAP